MIPVETLKDKFFPALTTNEVQEWMYDLRVKYRGLAYTRGDNKRLWTYYSEQE